MNKILNNVATFFKFEEKSTTFKKEIIGGIVTFLAMAYILAVNPAILSDADVPKGQKTNGYVGVFFLATALSAFISTIAMGLIANVPIALAPGMGINAFLTYTVASSILGLTLAEALVATFASGILYAIVSITPARKYIIRLLPKNIKLAIAAMIGLFLAYIGLTNSGIIVSGANSFGVSSGFGGVETPTKLGNFSDPFVIVSIATLLLIFVLHFCKVKGSAVIAILIGVFLLAILKWAGVQDANKAFKIQEYKDFDKFKVLSKDMWTSFGSAFAKGKFYIALFVFVYVDFFDTTGTLFAVGEQAKLNKNPKEMERWMSKANVVDAGSTIIGSVLLTSTTTSYIESSAGVSQGAKTGFASVVTGLLFLLAIGAWPIMSPILPIFHQQKGVYAQAKTIMPVTGPILVLVGALMISQLKVFDWKQTEDIPMLFITLLFGMLSYSISTGIAAGIIIYALINYGNYSILIIKHIYKKAFNKPVATEDKNNLAKQKQKLLNPVILALSLLAIVYFATLPLYFS